MDTEEKKIKIFTRKLMIKETFAGVNRYRKPLRNILVMAVLLAGSILLFPLRGGWRVLAVFLFIPAVIMLLAELLTNRPVLALLFKRFRIERGYLYKEPDPYEEDKTLRPEMTDCGFMYKHARDSYKIRTVKSSDIKPLTLYYGKIYYFVTYRSCRLIAVYPEEGHEMGEDLRPFFE